MCGCHVFVIILDLCLCVLFIFLSMEFMIYKIVQDPAFMVPYNYTQVGGRESYINKSFLNYLKCYKGNK